MKTKGARGAIVIGRQKAIFRRKSGDDYSGFEEVLPWEDTKQAINELGTMIDDLQRQGNYAVENGQEDNKMSDFDIKINLQNGEFTLYGEKLQIGMNESDVRSLLGNYLDERNMQKLSQNPDATIYCNRYSGKLYGIGGTPYLTFLEGKLFSVDFSLGLGSYAQLTGVKDFNNLRNRRKALNYAAQLLHINLIALWEKKEDKNTKNNGFIYYSDTYTFYVAFDREFLECNAGLLKREYVR